MSSQDSGKRKSSPGLRPLLLAASRDQHEGGPSHSKLLEQRRLHHTDSQDFQERSLPRIKPLRLPISPTQGEGEQTFHSGLKPFRLHQTKAQEMCESSPTTRAKPLRLPISPTLHEDVLSSNDRSKASQSCLSPAWKKGSPASAYRPELDRSYALQSDEENNLNSASSRKPHRQVSGNRLRINDDESTCDPFYLEGVANRLDQHAKMQENEYKPLVNSSVESAASYIKAPAEQPQTPRYQRHRRTTEVRLVQNEEFQARAVRASATYEKLAKWSVHDVQNGRQQDSETTNALPDDRGDDLSQMENSATDATIDDQERDRNLNFGEIPIAPVGDSLPDRSSSVNTAQDPSHQSQERRQTQRRITIVPEPDDLPRRRQRSKLLSPPPPPPASPSPSSSQLPSWDMSPTSPWNIPNNPVKLQVFGKNGVPIDQKNRRQTMKLAGIMITGHKTSGKFVFDPSNNALSDIVGGNGLRALSDLIVAMEKVPAIIKFVCSKKSIFRWRAMNTPVRMADTIQEIRSAARDIFRRMKIEPLFEDLEPLSPRIAFGEVNCSQRFTSSSDANKSSSLLLPSGILHMPVVQLPTMAHILEDSQPASGRRWPLKLWPWLSI
jgi:hypothetical protein